MLSECARATTAAEARFRIERPNSVPRTVSVVALDAPSEAIVDELAAHSWGGARFHRAPDLADPAALIDEVAAADLLVMITCAGEDVPTAAVIGEMCRLSRVTTTTLVVTGACASRDDTTRTLAQLRPYSDMLVATPSPDGFVEMLVALRA